MTVSTNISQHLEMMLNKKNRCEDWVTSVTRSKDCNKPEKDKQSDDEIFKIIDEYSDACDSSEVSTRRIRKTVVNKQLSLILTCEWFNCDSGNTSNKTTFIQHVAAHVSELTITQKPDGNPCYQCSWETCHFQSVDSSEMTRHVNFHAYHTILKAIACKLHILWELPECALASENKNSLPDLSSPFKCQVLSCEYRTDIFMTFINHVNLHIDSLDFYRKMSICCIWKGCTTFKCRRKTAMKLHMKRHTGEKSLACPTCGTMFTTNTKYMDHCNRKVPFRNECNQCQYCLRYYSNDRLLRDHMRYHINSQKCSFCEMTFSTPAVLANHIRYKHINARPFKCTLCPFSTVRADDCNAHMVIHEKEPRYRCQANECSYSCRSAMTLKKHFNSIHLKASAPIYRCHLCGKEYNRGPSLGRHLRIIHKLERLPDHSRFRYMKNKDGHYRLQVERYESLELNNIKAPLISTEECKMNFILKEESINDNELPKNYTITVDNNEEKEHSTTVSEKVLVDEEENLICTDTVHEELVDDTTCHRNTLLVDLPKHVRFDTEKVNIDKNTIQRNILTPVPSSKDKNSQTSNTSSRTINRSITVTSTSKKKSRKPINFTNVDCVNCEFVIRKE